MYENFIGVASNAKVGEKILYVLPEVKALYTFKKANRADAAGPAGPFEAAPVLYVHCEVPFEEVVQQLSDALVVSKVSVKGNVLITVGAMATGTEFPVFPLQVTAQ